MTMRGTDIVAFLMLAAVMTLYGCGGPEQMLRRLDNEQIRPVYDEKQINPVVEVPLPKAASHSRLDMDISKTESRPSNAPPRGIARGPQLEEYRKNYNPQFRGGRGRQVRNSIVIKRFRRSKRAVQLVKKLLHQIEDDKTLEETLHVILRNKEVMELVRSDRINIGKFPLPIRPVYDEKQINSVVEVPLPKAASHSRLDMDISKTESRPSNAPPRTLANKPEMERYRKNYNPQFRGGRLGRQARNAIVIERFRRSKRAVQLVKKLLHHVKDDETLEKTLHVILRNKKVMELVRRDRINIDKLD